MAVSKAVIGVVVGAVAVGVAGIWAWSSAQDEARKRVRAFVVENNLEDQVSYADVSYSPLSGELVIDDIRVLGDADAPRAKRAVLYRMEEAGDEAVPREISFALEGVAFDTMQVADLQPDVYQSLVTLGYRDLVGDLRVEYTRDPEQREFSMRLAVSVPNLGEIDFSGSLVNIDLADLAGQDAQQLAGNPLLLLGLLQRSLSDLAIARLQLEYRDYGLVKRYKLVEDARGRSWPDDPSRWDDLDGQRVELIRNLKGSGLDGAQAADIADALIDFIASPDVIRFRTDMDKPLKLQTLFAARQNPVETFFQLANAKVESD